VYRFDPSRRDLAFEFRAKPFGEHSPDLQYLLNLFRSSSPGGWHALVMTRPHEQWTLARMIEQPDGRPALPQLTNVTFDSIEAAEWAVFKLRWEALAGEPLDID
jgi:hypothetical protein